MQRAQPCLPWAMGSLSLRTKCINRNLISYSACLFCQDFLDLRSFTVNELKILRMLFSSFFPPKYAIFVAAVGLLRDHKGAQRSVSSYKRENALVQETTFLLKYDAYGRDVRLPQPSRSLHHVRNRY